jgi:DNA repair protein RadC
MQGYLEMRSTTSTKLVPPGEWQNDERPRERLMQAGAQHLSSAELLAVCLGTGVAGEDAYALARRLIDEFGGLTALLAAAPERLLTCYGLGVAKVAVLKSVHEITVRQDFERLCMPRGLTDVDAVSRYIRRRIGHREREVFGCLFLDTRHRPLCWEDMFLGSVNRAHVHSREVLKRGIELNAAALIIGHNHPSGVAEPSGADLSLTRELKDLLARVDIIVLDHIIVAPGASVSLASRGLLGN